MDLSLIKQKLIPLLEKRSEIAIAYLFGSQATSTSSEQSDVDIAVYFSEPDTVKRHNLLFSLSADMMHALGTDHIDAHSLNDIRSPLLKYRIMQEGIVLFEREPYRIILEPRILNEYSDFLYLLKKHNLTTV